MKPNNKQEPTIQDYFKSLWQVATTHAFARSIQKQAKETSEQAKQTLIKTGNGLKAASSAFLNEFKECSAHSSKQS